MRLDTWKAPADELNEKAKKTIAWCFRRPNKVILTCDSYASLLLSTSRGNSSEDYLLNMAQLYFSSRNFKGSCMVSSIHAVSSDDSRSSQCSEFMDMFSAFVRLAHNISFVSRRSFPGHS
jgi:hypothetical protein